MVCGDDARDGRPALPGAPRGRRGGHAAAAREAERALDRPAGGAHRVPSARSARTPTSARWCSPERPRPSARAWTPRQFGGDREHRERLVETSIGCFRAVGELRQAGGRRGQRRRAGRRLRPGPALRPSAGGRGSELRLPGAAARDPAELRRGARGAARRRWPPSSRSPAACSTPTAPCAWGSSAPSIPADELMPRAIELAGRIAVRPPPGDRRDEAADPARPGAHDRPSLRRGGAAAARGAARADGRQMTAQPDASGRCA